ncbi:MAG: hypothetical protein ACREFQ_21705 [Stellaceae bacterium]
MVKKIVEIEECGLTLVFCVEHPEPGEFAHEARECGGRNIGRKTLVGVAAAVIDRFCGGAELLASGLGQSGLAGGSLPFSFVLPCLKAQFAAVAAIWPDVAQKMDDRASGNRGAECLVEHLP